MASDPSSDPADQITQLLHRASDGDAEAGERLFHTVYEQLRQIARLQRRKAAGASSLDTTGLVHEAYLKIFHRISDSGGSARDREHFYAIAARAMRHILVDYARGRKRQKRGGDQERVELDEQRIALDRDADQILAVHQALDKLGQIEPRLAQVVECRFYAGLTTQETATAMAVSPRTAERCWSAAQSWLRNELAASS